MQYHDLVSSRYSVRAYDTRPVETALIRRILEDARLAPSAVNKQPWKILAVRGQEAMGRLAKCTKYTFGAPAAMIVGYDADKAWIRSYDNMNSGIIDASIISTYIMLSIHDLGLGSCWVGHFDPAALSAHMAVKFTPVAIFPFGYPALDAKPSTNHTKRLPLDETVQYDGDF